jgi:hypothetical protein
MKSQKEKKYVPVFTVHFTRAGELATPPYSVQCKGGVIEALVWFHLEQQLRAKIDPSAYSVQQVTSDHASPQRWGPDELPTSNLLSKVTLSKPMAKKFAGELSEFKAAGGFFSVA